MSEQQFKYIKIDVTDGVTDVTFQNGRFVDEDYIDLVAAELMKAADETANMAIDYANVEYVASHMLGKLIDLQRLFERKGGKLAFYAMPSDTYQIFRISRLEHYFKIYPDQEAALVALAS